jgi:hypothetical protein
MARAYPDPSAVKKTAKKGKNGARFAKAAIFNNEITFNSRGLTAFPVFWVTDAAAGGGT